MVVCACILNVLCVHVCVYCSCILYMRVCVCVRVLFGFIRMSISVT